MRRNPDGSVRFDVAITWSMWLAVVEVCAIVGGLLTGDGWPLIVALVAFAGMTHANSHALIAQDNPHHDTPPREGGKEE